MIKKILKVILVIFCILGALSGSFLFWVSNQYDVPVLMYHRVAYSSRPNPNTISPENFAKQMKYLSDHHYQVIPLADLVKIIKEKKPFPRKSVVITFDDGYEDNYTQAFPIIKQYNFPVMMFVVTDMVGKQGFLTWEQIKEMEKSSVSFGSHTRLHTYLPGVDKAEARNQIQISKEILEAQLGHPVEYFAYPSGGFNDTSLRLVKEFYLGACTTNRGYNRLNNDPHMIKRIRLSDKETDLSLWAKFSGYYKVFRRVRNPE